MKNKKIGAVLIVVLFLVSGMDVISTEVAGIDFDFEEILEWFEDLFLQTFEFGREGGDPGVPG